MWWLGAWQGDGIAAQPYTICQDPRKINVVARIYEVAEAFGLHV
jgi:hypothetical protein